MFNDKSIWILSPTLFINSDFVSYSNLVKTFLCPALIVRKKRREYTIRQRKKERASGIDNAMHLTMIVCLTRKKERDR